MPTYIYVIEGILVSEYEAGPVGIKGTQYHAAGQSFMDSGDVGWWHNLANRSDKPVKFLMLHLGYPGRPDPIQRPERKIETRRGLLLIRRVQQESRRRAAALRPIATSRRRP